MNQRAEEMELPVVSFAADVFRGPREYDRSRCVWGQARTSTASPLHWRLSRARFPTGRRREEVVLKRTGSDYQRVSFVTVTRLFSAIAVALHPLAAAAQVAARRQMAAIHMAGHHAWRSTMLPVSLARRRLLVVARCLPRIPVLAVRRREIAVFLLGAAFCGLTLVIASKLQRTHDVRAAKDVAAPHVGYIVMGPITKVQNRAADLMASPVVVPTVSSHDEPLPMVNIDAVKAAGYAADTRPERYVPSGNADLPAEALSSATLAELDIHSPRSLWYTAGSKYGIDPLLLYSVALVETGAPHGDNSVSPTPWIVRVDGQVIRGDEQTVAHAITDAQRRGASVQDVGVMQVYWPLHHDLATSPVALLPLAANIDAGARILREALNSSSDPVVAFGHYHSYTAARAKQYGEAVAQVYARVRSVMLHSSAAETSIASSFVASTGGVEK